MKTPDSTIVNAPLPPSAPPAKGTLLIRPILITGGLLTLSLAATFLIFRGVEPSPLISTHVLLLTLVNINIILVVVLILLLSRNLIKLYFERREKGPSFKNKLVAAFIGLSLIPCTLLFIVASGLLTSSIESGLSVQVERSLDASLKVAQDYYAQAQRMTQQDAQRIGVRLRDHQFFEGCPACLSRFLNEQKIEHDVAAISLWDAAKKQIASTKPVFEGASDSVQDLSQGFSEMISGGPITTTTTDPYGDRIRTTFVLERGPLEPIRLEVVRLIPHALINDIETIKKESAEYKQLKGFQRPIEGSYILSFFIVVLMIIFSATWFGFYLARRITVPIAKLAHGTAAVAKGNLDFQIDLTANDELGILVASFNKMTRDLKQNREALVRAEKIATWQEIALQMAHEIKNPLTPIQLSTERLKRKYLERSPEFDQIFNSSTDTIIHEVQRLVTLVNEFSTFARLPPGQRVFQEMMPIVQDVVQLYQSGHKETVFRVRSDEGLPLLRLDRDQIKRLLINLFENAIEASAGGGEISSDGAGPIGRAEREGGTVDVAVTYEASQQTVLLTVGDEGVGIAPDDVAHIFLPHFSRKGRGTGLGLAIVHQIVVDHGGAISVAPRKPQGTTFTIAFPVEGI